MYHSICKTILTITIYLFYLNTVFPQNFKNYILDNTINLNNPNKDSLFLKFINSDFFFIGETHYSKNIDSIRAQTVRLIISNSRINYLFLEEAVNSYEDLEKFSKSKKYEKCCNDFIINLEYYKKTLKVINHFNYSSFQQISIKPIDIFLPKQFGSYDILRLFKSRRNIPELINNDIRLLPKFYNTRKTKDKKFKKFVDNFESNEKFYQEYNDTIYLKIKMFVDAFNVYYNTLRINSNNLINPMRENLMYQNIIKHVNDTSRFISLNGLAHVITEPQNGRVSRISGWESLTYKIYKNYPDKKLCSIYILNKNEDDGMTLYFKEEKNELLKHLTFDSPVLINLRSKNSPFINMSSLFTHVLVY